MTHLRYEVGLAGRHDISGIVHLAASIPGEDPYLDTTRLTHDSGFAPTFDYATAVADYVAQRAGNPPLKEHAHA